ncbi:diguanylate cyclase [Leucothrix sargassi]|nr:diguanylate cyclase [Leucothrix sargassi]
MAFPSLTITDNKNNSMKILLVSNAHDTLINTKTALETKGHDVLVAEDGVSAWIQICDAKKRFQVVICDWLLPLPLDGLSLCKKIRSEQNTANTYVMLLTNRTSTTDLQNGIDAGADDFISAKHKNTDEIEAKLRTASRIIAFKKQIADKDTVIDALNLKLEQQSTKDKLTGLHNRRSFHVNLEDRIRLARRMEQPVSLIMLDIDGFKEIKEKHGVASSSGIVKLVTNILKEHCRTSDFIARFGAEKFGVILPSTDEKGSLKCAEGLVKAANLLFWEAAQVKVSIGAATVGHVQYASDDVCDLHTNLMSDAELALYNSQNAGSNKITHYTHLINNLDVAM